MQFKRRIQWVYVALKVPTHYVSNGDYLPISFKLAGK